MKIINYILLLLGSKKSYWENLVPDIVRQRVIIETITDHCIRKDEIEAYLAGLSSVLDMHPLSQPHAYPALHVGYGGWIHWITSGAHVYSYDAQFTGGKGHLLTIDAYTCKPFSVKKAVEFTQLYFRTEKIVWKEV